MKHVSISLLTVAVCFAGARHAAGAGFPTPGPGAVVVYATYDPNPGGYPIGLSGQNGSGPSYHVNPLPGLRDAVAFTTDTNTYQLDSVSLDITRLLGQPSDLVVSVYSDSGGAPGASLLRLTNPGSISQGACLFTGTNLYLSPATTYWVVAEPSLTEPCDFEWWPTVAPGVVGDSVLDASESFWGAWTTGSAASAPSVAVYGIVVPEPSALAFLGMGAAAWIGQRPRTSAARRRRTAGRYTDG